MYHLADGWIPLSRALGKIYIHPIESQRQLARTRWSVSFKFINKNPSDNLIRDDMDWVSQTDQLQDCRQADSFASQLVLQIRYSIAPCSRLT
jgi:hypothetical protein